MKKFERFEPILTGNIEINHNLENILKILELGNDSEKIRILESQDQTDEPEILKKIVLTLDDKEIKVRGEAYSSLLLNKNEILDFLIGDLNTGSENMKCSILLILANRNETPSIPSVLNLVKDDSPHVRSCAIGALGHLKYQQNDSIFIEALSDPNIEVRKSALQAIIDLNVLVSKQKMNKILEEKDNEIKNMLSLIEK